MEMIDKLFKHSTIIVAAAGSLFALYTRFLMDEREMEILQEKYENQQTLIKDHENRLRKIECR